MKRTNTKYLFLIVCLSVSMFSWGQGPSSARYRVVQNAMLDLIQKYPDKKEKIEQKIRSAHLYYMDYILLESSLIQIGRNYDNSIKGIKIFMEGEIYVISNTFELQEEEIESGIDSVTINQINNSNDSLFYYEFTESNAVPLTIVLSNPIQPDRFKGKSTKNNYPEFGFMLKYNSFPDKLIYGKPKTFMTFELLETLNESVNPSYKEIESLITKIESKKARKELFELLSQ